MTDCPQCDRDHARGSEECPARRIGETLDRKYRLEALQGVGGFGAVYRATHVHLGTPAAVKVLLPKFPNNSEVRERFLREAKV